MQPNKDYLEKVGEMININKVFERDQGYSRLILWSRLPEKITVRRGLCKYTYTLEYGDTDNRVYLAYADRNKSWKCPRKVLMHYEETTLRECMFKAWRNLAENGIKVKV